MLTRKIELKDLVNPKLQNLICYLAAKTGYLTEKRVHKLLYTAELYYIEHFYKRLTDVKFKNHNFGVWSPDIEGAKNWLDGVCLDIKEEKTKEGHPASFIELIEGFPIELADEEVQILDTVISDWAFKSTDELVAFTKSTLPWETSSFGEDIDFDAYIEECKLEDEFFNKEEVKKELKNIENEEFIPLDEL
jgi:uncharacterized phage-associated protein